MSIIGFAHNPETEVLPTCSIETISLLIIGDICVLKSNNNLQSVYKSLHPSKKEQ